MDDDALQAAIRALKLEDPDLTVKGIHAALEATGDRIELSVVKKAAGKVTKALAQEATKEKLNPPLPVPVKEAEGTSSTARKQQSTLPSARKQRAETASLREPVAVPLDKVPQPPGEFHAQALHVVRAVDVRRGFLQTSTISFLRLLPAPPRERLLQPVTHP